MNKPKFDLSGKVTLITGGSRGIGLAIAETYAAAGAKVILSSRKQKALDQAAKKIRAQGGQALPIAAHVGDMDAVTNLVARAVETYGGIDVLVNNAGTNPHFGPILTAEESHWHKILDVNLVGQFRLVKACVGQMRKRGGGKIINMASITGLQPRSWLGVYGVSKAGILMFTKVLALELAGDNIQVNAIAPGFIQTDFTRVLWENEANYKALTSQIPQGRMGTPQEITGLALYLASGESSFTTGAVFVIDGGHTLGGSV